MSTDMVVTIPIELDRPRRLRVDFDAFCTYEEITGESLFTNPPTSAVGIRALLFACLKHEDPTLTLEAVGKMIHVGNMKHVMAQIEKGMSAAMPQPVAGGPVPLDGTQS